MENDYNKRILNKAFLQPLLMILVGFGMMITLTGCVGLLKGEYYLGTQKYEAGIRVFEQELKKDPGAARIHYYLGRFQLAQKEIVKANTHLKKAVSLEPGNDTYHFWLGVSYGGLENPRMEIKSYGKAIALNNRNAQAHTYLGHSLFQSKKYLPALKSYDKALSIHSDNPSALYNRALILKRLKRIPGAISAFKQYLNAYGNSQKALRAAAYLNQMGNFEYRSHLFNQRKRVLKKIDFDPVTLELKEESLASLRIAGFMIKKDPNLVLHILSYQKNNKALAKKKAKTIKVYLLTYYPDIQPVQIQLSWFDSAERIKTGKKQYSLDDSINLFGVLKTGLK